MNESIDEVINEGVDLVLANPRLQRRVIQHLTKKVVLPYVICTAAFNLIVLILFYVYKLRRLPK